MLSINPAKRPTINDIINKPFIKPKIIEFISKCLSGSNNEDNDIFPEVLKLQAEKLNLFHHIQSNESKLILEPKLINDEYIKEIQTKLLQEIDLKEELEVKLKSKRCES